MTLFHRLAIRSVIAVLTFSVASGSWAAEIDIPFEKFVLDNGLTLIVHEDH